MSLTRTLVGALLLVGGVAAQDVSYNFDKKANFSNYKTYKWVQIKAPEQLDDLTRDQLTAAFDAELAS